MKKICLFALLLVFMGCRSQTFPDVVAIHPELEGEIPPAQLDTLAGVLKNYPNGIQVAIAIVEDSSVVYFGLKRQNDTLIRIDNAGSVFEIGSISKVFTATLLARAVVEDKVQLDQPIQSVLELELAVDTPVTFLQLANHTAGLPRIPSDMFWAAVFSRDNPYKDYDTAKLENYLSKKLKLKTPPGSEYRYSNLGYGLLGYTLCKVDGRTYEAMLQETIFRPLDMRATTTDRSGMKERLVPGLDEHGEPTSNWDLAALEGAGAILSTVEDLAKFAMANFDPENEIFSLQRRSTFTVNENMDLALGWHILKRPSGREWHWHNGGTGGYRSSMAIDVKKKKTVILLSNVCPELKETSKMDDLCFALMEE